MNSIEISAVRGQDIRCIENNTCVASTLGQACGRPAGLAFHVGGRLAPACSLHTADALGRGAIAIAGGAR